jgi:hypothetical protein
LFASVAKEAPKAASEKRLGLLWVYAKVVSNIFGKATKVLSSHIYVARQEGLRKWLKSYFKTV